jgi:hypothetical protein
LPSLPSPHPLSPSLPYCCVHDCLAFCSPAGQWIEQWHLYFGFGGLLRHVAFGSKSFSVFFLAWTTRRRWFVLLPRSILWHWESCTLDMYYEVSVGWPSYFTSRFSSTFNLDSEFNCYIVKGWIPFSCVRLSLMWHCIRPPLTCVWDVC